MLHKIFQPIRVSLKLREMGLFQNVSLIWLQYKLRLCGWFSAIRHPADARCKMFD